MYNALKKVFCSLMSMILVLFLALSVSAAENGNPNRENENYTDEYIVFRAGKERIESDGSFAFNVRSNLRAKPNFTAKKSSITISAKCKLKNVNNASYVSDASKEFTITLYDVDTGTEVDSFSGVADGTTYKKTFSVTKNNDYYFIISCNPTLTVPYSLEGSGSVSNVNVP